MSRLDVRKSKLLEEYVKTICTAPLVDLVDGEDSPFIIACSSAIPLTRDDINSNPHQTETSLGSEIEQKWGFRFTLAQQILYRSGAVDRILHILNDLSIDMITTSPMCLYWAVGLLRYILWSVNSMPYPHCPTPALNRLALELTTPPDIRANAIHVLANIISPPTISSHLPTLYGAFEVARDLWDHPEIMKGCGHLAGNMTCSDNTVLLGDRGRPLRDFLVNVISRHHLLIDGQVESVLIRDITTAFHNGRAESIHAIAEDTGVLPLINGLLAAKWAIDDDPNFQQSVASILEQVCHAFICPDSEEYDPLIVEYLSNTPVCEAGVLRSIVGDHLPEVDGFPLPAYDTAIIQAAEPASVFTPHNAAVLLPIYLRSPFRPLPNFAAQMLRVLKEHQSGSTAVSGVSDDLLLSIRSQMARFLVYSILWLENKQEDAHAGLMLDLLKFCWFNYFSVDDCMEAQRVCDDIGVNLRGWPEVCELLCAGEDGEESELSL